MDSSSARRTRRSRERHAASSARKRGFRRIARSSAERASSTASLRRGRSESSSGARCGRTIAFSSASNAESEAGFGRREAAARSSPTMSSSPLAGAAARLASLGRGACPRAHLARRLGERPGILEPLARLAPLRQDIDAFDEPVRMEVVEIAKLDLRAAPVPEWHVHRHLKAAELLLEDVPVDGVCLPRREGTGAGAAEITEDEEAERCLGIERLRATSACRSPASHRRFRTAGAWTSRPPRDGAQV